MRSVLRFLGRRVTLFTSVLAALALAVTTLASSVPASAAITTHGHPAAVKPDNKVAVPGAMADMATAKREHRKVEITADRTAFSQTFANPNGTLTTSVSQQPRWARRGDSWVPASAALTRAADGSWSPKAAETGLRLSGGGTRTLATLDSGTHTMSLSWPSVLPAPSVTGPRATYAGVFPGVDLLVTAQASGGFTETLVVHSASAARDPQLSHLRLGVALSAGLRQKAGRDGAVTVRTASGQAVFASPAPSAWDSARAAGPGTASTAAGPGRGAHAARVTTSYQAGSVTMSIPRSLTGLSTAYPVYVDPSYSQTQSYVVYGELQSAYPTTSEVNATSDGNVSVGYDGTGVDRGDYEFGLPQLPTYPSWLPVTVSSATITAEAVKTQTSSSESHTVNAYYTSEYDESASPTWDNPPSRLAGPVAATFTTASTTPNQNVSWSVTSWLQTALNSDDWQVSAELVNGNEASTSQFAEFGWDPTLTYTYSQAAPSVPVGTGPASNATQLKFPISDKASLQVNVGSGNALVTTSDISLPEQSGSLTLGVDYNSLLAGSQLAVGSAGPGWRQREGADVRLYLGSDGTLTYVGEDGTAGKFSAPASGSNTYGSPPEFHVTLASSSGSTCGGTGYTMTWHATGKVMCFNANGLLTSEADRNGNTTAFSYNSFGDETQVTYTPKGASSPAETVTASYTSDGLYLTSLSESGGSLGTRTVTYGGNSQGELTSVQQADGTTIRFGYDSAGDLTSIENGAGATTTLCYNSSHQVTSVSQPYGSSGKTATTRLSYVSSTETQVATPNTDQSQPVSSVPNTTYTINSQDLVTKAVDPAGNTRSTSYTPFNDVASSTNGAGGTTTNTYGANSGESLTSSETPMGATGKLAYGNSGTAANPTAPFQPSSSTDPQGHTTTYSYDGAGNLLQSADALPATAKVTYNSDGTPATSTDPGNVSSSNSTKYTYNSLHQLTKITPVTGSSLQAETITYDGFGRVATVTSGNGDTVTYSYDLADRVTKEAYTGSSASVTVSYSYDGAGNLKNQTDSSGITAYTYDGRNMVLTKTAASGGGTLTYDYDADGNLASASDAGGTTTYSYDSRDLLSSLTDPAGNLWKFGYNADGLRTTTWFATNSAETTWGMKTVTSYDKADRISRIQTYRDSTTSDVVSDTSYCYSPYVSGQSCPTSQNTSTDKAIVQYSVNNQTGTVSQYTYDTGNRLKSVTNDGGQNYSYGYDTDGNVTSGTAKGTETYNSANQSTVSGYTYDGAGNLTATPGNGTLTYNDAGQWTGASNASGNGPESFSYAGAGQNEVLSDGSASGITYGLAGQDGEPWVQSYTPSGSATDYVLRDQQGTPLGYVSNGTAYAYAADNQGSVIGVIGSDGTVDATYAYDPYGHQTSATGTDAGQNLIRYAGALFDSASSNYSTFGARWYNPVTAFFTTQDTNSYLDNPANGNRYAYAADNPLNYTDPTGNSVLGCIGAIVGVVASAGAVIGISIGTAGTADVFAAGALIVGAGTAAEQVSFFSSVGSFLGAGIGAGAAC